jgi:hypothetical protein
MCVIKPGQHSSAFQIDNWYAGLFPTGDLLVAAYRHNMIVCDGNRFGFRAGWVHSPDLSVDEQQCGRGLRLRADER